jgi:hypothetical protein
MLLVASPCHVCPLVRNREPPNDSPLPHEILYWRASIILIPVPCIFYYFVLWPTNAQLFHKLSHSHVFRHLRVLLRELISNTLPSYTTISNAAIGNTIYNRFYASSHIIKPIWNILLVICITNSCIWNTCVTWHGIDYKLPEYDTIVSKHVGVW